jgi:hypothetical protein
MLGGIGTLWPPYKGVMSQLSVLMILLKSLYSTVGVRSSLPDSGLHDLSLTSCFGCPLIWQLSLLLVEFPAIIEKYCKSVDASFKF